MTDPHDVDDVDGCGLDFAADAVDDETASLLPLFPDSVPDDARAQGWRDLGALERRSRP